MVPTAASMLISEQSVLLTCVGMENDTVLSLVTVSVGFTMEGFFSWITTTRIEHETQKRCPLHYRGLECKSMKSRDTWSNRQIWPWNVEWSRTKNNRVLPRKCTGHSKHPLPTTKEKTLHMDITRWSTPKSDWLYFFAAKDGEALYSQQKQDQELTVAQIMSSLLPNSDSNWRK